MYVSMVWICYSNTELHHEETTSQRKYEWKMRIDFVNMTSWANLNGDETNDNEFIFNDADYFSRFV